MKGYGTINGSGDYEFSLSARDGDPYTFRIRIWENGTPARVEYDNGIEQAINGSSIVVHEAK
ncbi:MAG: hypothetical protein ABIB93_02155 [Chloroflexota bacterium]